MTRSHAALVTSRRVACALLASALVAACGTASSAAGPRGGDAALGKGSETPGTALRLGYLANITHAGAIVGVDRGFLGRALGPDVTLRTQTFKAGPSEVTALIGGSLDAAYIGPNPAINAYVRSHGAALRIVSGATAGGASLVVRADAGISGASDLRGKTLATPQLGNSQDVALRAWLARNGLHVDPTGGGDVKIAPTDNATSLQLFQQHRIDGAWVPEPWATRLVVEGHGRVLVDEATQWPGGRFPTTELVVTRRFLDDHPVAVRRLLEGHLAATGYLASNPAEARTVVNDGIGRITQKQLSPTVVAEAWSHLSFTVDPLAAALSRSAADAHAAGLLDRVDVGGILDLRILDDLLAARGTPAVDAAGLQA